MIQRPFLRNAALYRETTEKGKPTGLRRACLDGAAERFFICS